MIKYLFCRCRCRTSEAGEIVTMQDFIEEDSRQKEAQQQAEALARQQASQ